MNAVKALREAGLNIKGMLAIFTYGFETSVQSFEQQQVTLYTLSNYESLLEQAQETGYINEKEMQTLTAWNKAPEVWNGV